MLAVTINNTSTINASNNAQRFSREKIFLSLPNNVPSSSIELDYNIWKNSRPMLYRSAVSFVDQRSYGLRESHTHNIRVEKFSTARTILCKCVPCLSISALHGCVVHGQPVAQCETAARGNAASAGYLTTIRAACRDGNLRMRGGGSGGCARKAHDVSVEQLSGTGKVLAVNLPTVPAHRTVVNPDIVRRRGISSSRGNTARRARDIGVIDFSGIDGHLAKLLRRCPAGIMQAYRIGVEQLSGTGVVLGISPPAVAFLGMGIDH